MSRIKFILNDETKKNQFGFRVRNSGLKLSRFESNPVILDNHQNGNYAVIGRWLNIQVEGHLLTAEAEFDDQDPNAQLIAGKVERGFIRGASLGLDPFTMSNFVLAPDDVYDLVESEVLEASVVAIPNNANALVKLYASSEESIKELLETEVSEILLMASEMSKFNLNNHMKKITLNLSAVAALGLPGNSLEHDENLVNEKIITLKSELDAANVKVQGFEALDIEKKAKLSADTVDADIQSGKIPDATKRADFLKLHAEFPDMYKTMVTDAKPKSNLGAQVNNPAGPTEVKTFGEFEKLDLSAQLAFKTNYPTEYQALFK